MNMPFVTQKASFAVQKPSYVRPWNFASAFLVSLCVLGFRDLGSGFILLSPTSLPASDKFEGKLVGVPGAAPKSCAGGLNGLATGELVCARRLGNVAVTGVEALLAVAPKGWPKGVVDEAAPKGVAELGALNGDEGAVCPNARAVDGALPNTPFGAPPPPPTVNPHSHP